MSAKRKSFAEEQKQVGSSKRAAALRLKERDASRPLQGSALTAAEGDETSATGVNFPKAHPTPGTLSFEVFAEVAFHIYTHAMHSHLLKLYTSATHVTLFQEWHVTRSYIRMSLLSAAISAVVSMPIVVHIRFQMSKVCW